MSRYQIDAPVYYRDQQKETSSTFGECVCVCVCVCVSCLKAIEDNNLDNVRKQSSGNQGKSWSLAQLSNFAREIKQPPLPYSSGYNDFLCLASAAYKSHGVLLSPSFLLLLQDSSNTEMEFGTQYHYLNDWSHGC